jgi:hypothetical protein
MIPDKILKFLEQQANLGLAGTRDHHLAPHGHRISAWRVHPDRKTLTAFIGDSFLQRFLDSVAENGQIALTVEEFPLHETYQLKGRYLSHRPIRPDEAELVNQARDRVAKSIRNLSPDIQTLGKLLRASIPDATLAVEMEIREVFLQTPGPRAGSRVYPPPAEENLNPGHGR